MQNGLPEEALAAVLGKERVYGCTLSWGAEIECAGVVRITSESGYRAAIGAFGNGSRLRELHAMLCGALTAATVGNLAEIRFAKLAVNASFSTLSAISGLTFGEISVRYKKYALALMRETFAVARAFGCKKLLLNGYDLFKVFRRPFGRLLLPAAMKKYRNTRSGMLKDLEAGRRCDVDFVAGAVVKAGESRATRTPRLTRAVALVHDIENGFAELSPESLPLIWETAL